MDTRIGYPNEHLANDVSEELASPMYATGIGLVIEGADRYLKEVSKFMQEDVAGVPEGVETEEDEDDEYDYDDPSSRPSSFLKKIQDFFEKDGV